MGLDQESPQENRKNEENFRGMVLFGTKMRKALNNPHLNKPTRNYVQRDSKQNERNGRNRGAPYRCHLWKLRFSQHPREGILAGATGLEPATYGVTGRHSNQLSYAPAGAFNGVSRERRADVGPRLCQVKQAISCFLSGLHFFP